MASESRKLAEILASGPLKPAKLSHVVLRTPRLHPTRDWYLTALNGRVQYEGATVCFLTYDDEHHRLGIVQIPGVTDESGSGPGLEHISFAYRSLGELLANYQRLKALDIVNPQEMIQKFEAGVSLDEILKRPKLPAGKTPWDMHRA
jgi:catechol-2,3-dioxygenase